MSAVSPLLIAYDASADARNAIWRAGALVTGPAIVLTVCERAADLPLYAWGPLGNVVGRLAGLAREFDEAGEAVAQRTAEEGALLAREHGFDARPQAVSGSPWQSIVTAADDADARLIVVGARGLSAVQSTLLGSVTAAVLHHARRPVLVVPPHGDASRPVGSTPVA